MSPVIFPVSGSTFPQAGVIGVPCYRAQSFGGRTAVLVPEDISVDFDRATLTARDLELATGERGEEWTIRGLIAVDVDWLIEVMEVTTASQKALGAQIDDVWYHVSPINMEPTVVAGHWVVVGLYR